MTLERKRLLAECAALARRLAPEQCWHEPGTGESCAWYHGFWPYLRLLDYGSSPELHKAFFIEGLAPLTKATTPARVLISGAADFAMLEVAREAFQAAPAPPRLTVTDRCDTPLALCRWYAEQAGFTIESRAGDILSFEDEDGFDAIVTHSFLGNFPPEARPPLARRWFALLRPGGRLITINRLRAGDAPATTVFSEHEAAAFTTRLIADLQRQQELLDAPATEIAALAEPYLREKRSYPLRSEAELKTLLEDAGFQLEVFDRLGTGDPGGARPSGPTMPGKATYLKIIAQRPA